MPIFCFTTVPWLSILHINFIFIVSHLFSVVTLMAWRVSLPTFASPPFNSWVYFTWILFYCFSFVFSCFFDGVKEVVANICLTIVPWLSILHINIIFYKFSFVFSCYFDGVNEVIANICLTTFTCWASFTWTLFYCFSCDFSCFFDGVQGVVANVCFTTVPWLIVLHMNINP